MAFVKILTELLAGLTSGWVSDSSEGVKCCRYVASMDASSIGGISEVLLISKLSAAKYLVEVQEVKIGVILTW